MRYCTNTLQTLRVLAKRRYEMQMGAAHFTFITNIFNHTLQYEFTFKYNHKLVLMFIIYSLHVMMAFRRNM
jgi:hypothetical protein